MRSRFRLDREHNSKSEQAPTFTDVLPVNVGDEQFDMFGAPGEAGALATPVLGPARLSDDWQR